MPPTSPTVRQYRICFYAIDALFIAAWTIWVPSYLLYLQTLFDNPSLPITLLCISLISMALLEVTAGAIADLLPGQSTFYAACGVSGIAYIVYALAAVIDPILRLPFAVAGECLAAAGLAFFSGGFERWFQSTMELVGYRGTPSESFAGLKTTRQIVAIIAGSLGIFLYDAFHTSGSIYLVPFFWAGVLALLAGITAATMQSWLRSAPILLADGTMGSTDTSPQRPNRKNVGGAIQQGWLAFWSFRNLRGSLYFAQAHYIIVNVLGFFVPVFVWVNFERSVALTVGAWSMIRASRAAGSALGGPVWRRLKYTEHSALIVALTSAGLLLVVAGALATPRVRPPDAASITLILSTAALIGFALGWAEPLVDGMITEAAPPDLRSICFSYVSALRAIGLALCFLPLNLMSMWHFDQTPSHAHFFGAAGMFVLALTLHGIASIWRVRIPRANDV